MLLPAPPPPRMPMWLSMIWKSSPGCGIRPDSILDQTGMSFREISNAPVLMSCYKEQTINTDRTNCQYHMKDEGLTCVSTALQRKKVIMQA